MRFNTSSAIFTLFMLTLLVSSCGSGDTADPSTDLLATRLEPGSPQTFYDVIRGELDTSDAVIRCMKEQGFEYQPYRYSREQERLPKMIAASTDTEAFATQYGYGVTNPAMTQPAADEVMMPIDIDSEIALYGRPVSEMAQDGEPPAGCWGEHTRPMIEAVDVFGRAQKELNTLVDGDADVETLRAEWSRCMATHGYSFYSPSEAVDHFRDAAGNLMMSSGPGSPLLQEDFDALLAEEIATALIDQMTCGGENLRDARLTAAAEIGLDEEATDALEQLARTPES